MMDIGGQIFHGGRLDAAKREFGDGDWLDLSTGINPSSYPVGQVSEDAWQRLPSDAALELLYETARKAYRLAPEQGIVAANGTQALIEQLPRLILAKQVAVFGPTYAEHAHCWRKAGASVSDLAHGDGLPEGTDCVVVVHPNNPDGRIWEREELARIAADLRSRNGTLIVDEAFCDAFPEASMIPDQPVNAIVLRSFGKFYGLAGLRLGFAVGTRTFCRLAESNMGPWAMSGPAIEIGTKALGDLVWTEEMRKSLKELSREQAEMLGKAGFRIAGTNPLFVYCAHEQAGKIHQELCKRHILVRPFAEIPDRLRFGLCGNSLQFERLKTALLEILESPGDVG